MILHALEVRDVRGIRAARFDAFSSSLNLLTGPNESGKSTLVAALHFALFERTRGQAEHKRSLRSWGSDEAPEIRVVLEDDDGTVWEIDKRFLDRPSTEVLVGANLRLKGDAAEARLRELLGTQPGSRYGLTDDDLGIWPLLWVRQGTSGLAPKDALTATVRDELVTTLTDHAGAMLLDARSRALLDQVDAEVARWQTPTGRATRAMRDLEAAVQEAQIARDETREALQRWHAEVEEHRRLADEVSDLDRRVATLRQQAETAVTRARRAEALSEARGRAAMALDVARTRLQHAVERRTRLEDAEQRRAHQATLHDAARTSLATVEAEHVRHQAARERARAVTARLEGELRGLQEAARLADPDDPTHTAEASDDLEARIADAEALEQRARQLRDTLADRGLVRGDATRLTQALAAVDDARRRARQGAPRLVVTLAVDATIDGEPVAAGETIARTIDRTLTLSIPGAAELVLAPPEGAGDAVLEARAHLTELTDHLGVRDEDDARARLSAHDELSAELSQVSEALTVLAPEGLGQLRTALRRARARAERLAQARASGAPADLTAALASRTAELDAARVDVAAAEAAMKPLGQRLDLLRQEMTDAASAVAAADGALSQLGAPSEIRQAESDAERALASALRAHDEAVAAFDAAGGDDALGEARRTREALQRLSARRDVRAARQRSLKDTLETDAGSGRHDALVRATAALAAAETAMADAQAQIRLALAARDTLIAAHRRRVERYAEPLRAAVEDWLGLLFPGSTLALDDDGDVIGLRTGGVVEDFASLSEGTREQLGVLVRLGLARVLARGRRLPVVLDDALVSADALRRARMVEVLRRASDHLQILVFTCHEEDFDRLAAPWHAEVRARPPRG